MRLRSLMRNRVHCLKKVHPLMFDNNFGKCRPIFIILSAVDRRKIHYVYTTKISTSPAICCYTTLWKLKIQKMLLILIACSANCWHVAEDTLNTWFNILTVVKTGDIDWPTSALKFVRRRLKSTHECCSVERCCIMMIFFTMNIFAPYWFSLGYTSYVVHVFK